MRNLSLNFLPNQNFPCPRNRPSAEDQGTKLEKKGKDQLGGPIFPSSENEEGTGAGRKNSSNDCSVQMGTEVAVGDGQEDDENSMFSDDELSWSGELTLSSRRSNRSDVAGHGEDEEEEEIAWDQLDLDSDPETGPLTSSVIIKSRETSAPPPTSNAQGRRETLTSNRVVVHYSSMQMMTTRSGCEIQIRFCRRPWYTWWAA